MLGVDIGTTRIKADFLSLGVISPELFRFGIEDECSFAPALFYVAFKERNNVLCGIMWKSRTLARDLNE